MPLPPSGPRDTGPGVRCRLQPLCLLFLLVPIAGCRDGRSVVDQGLSLSWAGDRIRAGEAVTVSDTVPGDVMLAGGDVRFNGFAGGTYLGAGGAQEIGGWVENSLRAAGGEVRLRGRVGRNVTVAGGAVVVEQGATVERNAYLAGGRVDVRGTVLGSLRVTAREVLLDGPVRGDVEVEAERLRLGPDARIEGDLGYRLDGEEASMDPDARVSGEITPGLSRSEAEGDGSRGVLFRVLRILAFVLAGTAVVALFPGTADRLSAVVRERTLPSLGVGLLLLVATPMAVGVLALTVLGIPLALILALLFGIALYLGAIPPALWLGDALLPGPPDGRRAARAAAFAAGGAVVAVVSFVPAVGLLVRLLFILVGLGAAGLAIRGRRGGAAG